jgi:citrate lyase subunit beta / citryl-CoA lyase
VILRSLLFVPADSEKKLAKARTSPADALILDLEDSVVPERRATARGLVREFLREQHAQAIWVRINPVGSEDAKADLELAKEEPAGLMVPKPDGPDALRAVDRELAALEMANGLPQGGIKLLPVATETPHAVLNLMEYRNPPPRLAAMTWGAEDLSAALGASANREADGAFSFPYKVVRALTLIAAKAAGVAAIETLHSDFRDGPGLDRAARAAQRDGFSGMLAIHPDQVDVINRAFTPSPADVAWSKRVVEAFAGGEGVVSLDGKMLDKPHLTRAENILAVAEALAKRP